jgi:hypothetical protein
LAARSLAPAVRYFIFLKTIDDHCNSLCLRKGEKKGLKTVIFTTCGKGLENNNTLQTTLFPPFPQVDLIQQQPKNRNIYN